VPRPVHGSDLLARHLPWGAVDDRDPAEGTTTILRMVEPSFHDDLCQRLRRLARMIEQGYPPTDLVDRQVVEEFNDVLAAARERGLPVRPLIEENDQQTATGLRTLMATARAAIDCAPPPPPRRTSGSLKVRLLDD
jgi:hypothetical protein